MWCVYFHCRPDGSVFYVGKGVVRRAYDFAPSRRTQHHKNIVNKYGRKNIVVRVIPCESEAEAFEREQGSIKGLRSAGIELANLTDGGEGASGRAANERQRAALQKGRGQDAYQRLSDEAKGNILDGLARGRLKRKGWENSPAGREQIRMLSELGPKVLHREREACCAQCGEYFKTRSAKAKCCSRLCEQRRRRARDACPPEMRGVWVATYQPPSLLTDRNRHEAQAA